MYTVGTPLTGHHWDRVLNREVSSFQGLLSTQIMYLGLRKCPAYGGVLNSGVSL